MGPRETTKRVNELIKKMGLAGWRASIEPKEPHIPFIQLRLVNSPDEYSYLYLGDISEEELLDEKSFISMIAMRIDGIIDEASLSIKEGWMEPGILEEYGYTLIDGADVKEQIMAYIKRQNSHS